MPNTKSATKRLRQNVVRKTHSRSIKQGVRTQIRKVREAIEANDTNLAETEFRTVSKKLDRAAARNVIHRNSAARLKSRLSAKIKALKTA